MSGSGSADAEDGGWFVFETFAADGTLAVGVAAGRPDPSQVLVVHEGLSHAAAIEAVAAHARQRQREGRTLASGGSGDDLP